MAAKVQRTLSARGPGLRRDIVSGHRGESAGADHDSIIVTSKNAASSASVWWMRETGPHECLNYDPETRNLCGFSLPFTLMPTGQELLKRLQ